MDICAIILFNYNKCKEQQYKTAAAELERSIRVNYEPSKNKQSFVRTFSIQKTVNKDGYMVKKLN